MSLVAGKLVTSGSVRLLEWQFAVVDLENTSAAYRRHSRRQYHQSNILSLHFRS